MIMTDKGYSGQAIWLEILNQCTQTKDIFFTSWYKKAMK